MANPFIHVELMTHNVAEAKRFYSALFDWKLEDVPGMDYTMVNVGEGTGGGMMEHPMPDAPSNWMPYVLVEDISVTTDKAKELGATIVKDISEIPGVGWFSVFIDPTGATLSLWQMMPAADEKR